MTNDDSHGAQGTPPPPPGGMAPPPPPPAPPGAPAPAPQPPAPAPAAPVAAPAPAYAPQPQYAAQQPPAAPPKKRNGAVIAVIITILLLCIAASCIGVFLFAASGSNDTEAISQAEVHFTAAENSVAKVEEAITAAGDAEDPEAVSAAVDQADAALRVGRDEIAAAKASIEQIEDSQGKTDYLAALDAATATLDGLQDLVAYMDTASGMVAKAAQAAEVVAQANSAMESAISRANGNSYSTMASKAALAAKLYAQATILFEEADKLDKSAGFKKAAAYAEKRRQQANIVIRMASEGRAGRVSAYNADIKRQAALGKAAVAIGLPAIVTDPAWAENRLASLTESITAEAARVDDLRLKALTELEYRP